MNDIFFESCNGKREHIRQEESNSQSKRFMKSRSFDDIICIISISYGVMKCSTNARSQFWKCCNGKVGFSWQTKKKVS